MENIGAPNDVLVGSATYCYLWVWNITYRITVQKNNKEFPFWMKCIAGDGANAFLATHPLISRERSCHLANDSLETI